ncbi:MAG: hypothetical protein ACQCN4_03260 [Candidatus Bathyarchaeia archaeon]|jgi:hypothetical protein
MKEERVAYPGDVAVTCRVDDEVKNGRGESLMACDVEAAFIDGKPQVGRRFNNIYAFSVPNRKHSDFFNSHGLVVNFVEGVVCEVKTIGSGVEVKERWLVCDAP